MSRIKRTSPALVISILALIAALVVPALAQVATTALTKKETRVVRKVARLQANKQITKRTPRIANSQITSRAPGLNVNSAETADNASTANGVRPVKVDFTAASNSGQTVLLNEAGILIRGECTAGGDASIRIDETASNAVIHWSGVAEQYSTGFVTSTATFDTPFSVQTTGSGPTRAWATTLRHRAANGTRVTGNLQIERGTGVAQCVISGILFVG
jgi:hypothetical protein